MALKYHFGEGVLVCGKSRQNTLVSIDIWDYINDP